MNAPLDPRVQMALNRVRTANETMAALERHHTVTPRGLIAVGLKQVHIDLSIAAGQLAAVIEDLPLNSALTSPVTGHTSQAAEEGGRA